MKKLNLFLLFFTLILISSCRPERQDSDNDQNNITMLNEEEVLKLSPYMTDLKKVGDLITIHDTLMVTDSMTVIQPRSKQLFTFRVMVDENDVPVMPDTSSTTSERRVGDWRNGGIETFCMGGCIVFIGSSLCLLDYCKPYDNGCGCKPPVCGGGCETWACSSEILGFMSGGISIK